MSKNVWLFNTRDCPLRYRSDGSRVDGLTHVHTDVFDPVTKAALERGFLVVALSPFRSSDIEVVSEPDAKSSDKRKVKDPQPTKKQRSRTSAAVAKES